MHFDDYSQWYNNTVYVLVIYTTALRCIYVYELQMQETRGRKAAADFRIGTTFTQMHNIGQKSKG